MLFHEIINKLLGDASHIRVFSVLAKSKRGLSGRELAGLVGVSTFKIHHVLKFLTAQGVVLKSVSGRSNLYRLNEEHVLTEEIILPILNFESEIFQRIGSHLMNSLKPKPMSIIIFGSIARKEETPQSDIDILFVYEDGKTPEHADSPFLTKMPFRYGNSPIAMVISISDLQMRYSKKELLLRNIFREGFTIAGLSMMEVLNYGRKKNIRSTNSKK